MLPHHPMLYAMLRQAHTVLGFLLFATFVAHLSGAMMHVLLFSRRWV
jgi:hypothetical protein